MPTEDRPSHLPPDPGEEVVRLAQSAAKNVREAAAEIAENLHTLQTHEQLVVLEEVAALEREARDLIGKIEEHFPGGAT